MLETFELEGWRVSSCEDSCAALRMIASGRHYDLLTLDNDLPGASGLDVIRHARQLLQRRHTPIIMLSAGLHQAEARRAGADDFLSEAFFWAVFNSASASTTLALLQRQPFRLLKPQPLGVRTLGCRDGRAQAAYFDHQAMDVREHRVVSAERPHPLDDPVNLSFTDH